MRWSIGFRSSPRQYAPATLVNLIAASLPVVGHHVRAGVPNDVEARRIGFANDFERLAFRHRRHQIVDLSADANRHDVLAELSFASELFARHDPAGPRVEVRLTHAESLE